MARKGRQLSDTGIYHIVLRGINKKAIYDNDEDKKYFVKLLSKNTEKFHSKVFAFCIMKNHVHILIQEGDNGISNLFQRIAGTYALYYNKKYARSGPLFESRFRSKPVESIYYFFQIIRYIHQNPYHAGIAKNLEDYVWSSFSTYLGKDNKNQFAFICTELVYRHTSMTEFVKFNLQFSKSAALKYLTCLWPIRISDNALYQIAQNFMTQFGESLEIRTTKILSNLVRYLTQLSGVTKAQIARLLKLSRFQINKILKSEC